MIANARHLPLSIAVVIWLNALPYVSRLPRGTGWVAEYLPDEGFLVPGLIFSHAMYSMPAIPLIWALRHREKPGLVWTLAFVVVTAFTWYAHKDYDMSADAQAATGLVVFPLVAMVAAYAVLAIDRELRRLINESLKRIFVTKNTRKNFGLLEKIPGFNNLPETLQVMIVFVLVSLSFTLFTLIFAP